MSTFGIVHRFPGGTREQRRLATPVVLDAVSVRAASYVDEHMFQSSAHRLRTWLMGAGDLLGDPEARDRERQDFRTHPHRRDLRWERARRAGSVAARPAYCLSPVRSAPYRVERAPVAR